MSVTPALVSAKNTTMSIVNIVQRHAVNVPNYAIKWLPKLQETCLNGKLTGLFLLEISTKDRM